MQYQKRGYIKTYDENGNLLTKVPVEEVKQEEVLDEAAAEEEEEDDDA